MSQTENFMGVGSIVIDTTHTGTRTINAGSASGAQGNDVLGTPGTGAWMSGDGMNNGTDGIDVRNSFGGGITNGPANQCPVINITWQTTR